MLQEIGKRIGTAIISLGQGKRPVMLDRLIRSALSSLGADAGDEAVERVRMQLIKTVSEDVAQDRDRLDAELKKTKAELSRAQKKPRAEPEGVTLSEQEVDRLRVYCRYGLSHEGAARIFNVRVADIRRIVDGKGVMRFPSGRERGPAPGRALDL